MRKNILLILILISIISCDNRTPRQKAQDEYNKEKADSNEKSMRKEHVIDSLVNVAGGIGEYKYQLNNRRNALKILKKEYPNLDWSKIENDINSNQ